MKHFLLVAIAIALFFPANSQSSESFSDKKNEINIGFFNAFELSNVSDFGIGYKRMTYKGAWRFGTSFGLRDYKTDYENTNISSSTFNYLSLTPRIGYEWHQNFNRLQLQYGTDLTAGFYRNKTEDVDNITDYYRLRETIRNTYSIRPFLGLTVFISNSISLSTETYLNIGYSHQTVEESYNSTSSSQSTEKGSSVSLGPLGVFSINIHF